MELTDKRVIEIFLTARSIPALGSEALRAERAAFALARYRPLLEPPRTAAVARSGALSTWFLDILGAASPETVCADMLVLDFVTAAVWHSSEYARALALLAKAFDWRLKPLLLALGLDAQPPSTRAIEVCVWLLAHARLTCADDLAILLVPSLKRFVQTFLGGRDLARAQALELLAEVAIRAPSLSDTLAPVFWHALLLDTMPLREQATALCFDVLFVLLGRGVLAEDSGGARSGDGARGFGAMLPFLPRMLAAPSALMQRATVAGVSRLCWHASKDARFEAAVIGVMEDECFLDECLLQLVLRYVDTSSRAEVQGAASRATAGPSARRTVLTAEDNCEIIKDIDHALSCLDEGVIADAAVYVVVAALSNEAIDPRTAEGFGAHDSHKRRALHELVRRLASPELRAQLAESVGSTSADLFSFAPDPSHVRAWLQL